MELSKDFKEFIKLLNEHKVQYLVVGGYAVALHGHPRYTKDLDVWVKRDKANAERLLKVLKDFGFGSLDITIEDVLNPDVVIQLGNPPNRLDLMSDLTGVEFDDCYSKRLSMKIKQTKIDVIDLENLKKNKRAIGRHQDLADIENLE
ncbi:MAG: nucleotidyltransferase [Ignavibacteriae bacterium]|nr:nucleotidyltransferase [Ignavibacteriota bacterium]